MKLLIPLTLASMVGLGALMGPGARASASTSVVGVLAPYDVVSVGAPVDGILIAIHHVIGDTVAAGAPIASLEASAERADLAVCDERARATARVDAALAALSDARQRLEQREALATAGLVTAEEVDELRTEVHVRELALLGAEEEHLIAVLERDRSWTMLARLEIAAPAGGVVTARPLSPGELVSRSGMSTLLEISQLHPLLIDVHVPIDSWSSIEVGDEAEVEVLAPGIAMRTATVSYVSPIADAGSETFLVRLELPNPDHALPAGLRARVHLTE